MSYFSDISVITTKQGLKELTKNEIFHDMVTAEDIAFLKEDVYLFYIFEVKGWHVSFDDVKDFMDIIQRQKYVEFVRTGEVDGDCEQICAGDRSCQNEGEPYFEIIDGYCCDVHMTDEMRRLTPEEIEEIGLISNGKGRGGRVDFLFI